MMLFCLTKRSFQPKYNSIPSLCYAHQYRKAQGEKISITPWCWLKRLSWISKIIEYTFFISSVKDLIKNSIELYYTNLYELWCFRGPFAFTIHRNVYFIDLNLILNKWTLKIWFIQHILKINHTSNWCWDNVHENIIICKSWSSKSYYSILFAFISSFRVLMLIKYIYLMSNI